MCPFPGTCMSKSHPEIQRRNDSFRNQKDSACQNRKGHLYFLGQIPSVGRLGRRSKERRNGLLEIVHNWQWQTDVIIKTLDSLFSISTIPVGTHFINRGLLSSQEWHSQSLGANQEVICWPSSRAVLPSPCTAPPSLMDPQVLNSPIWQLRFQDQCPIVAPFLF